MAMPRSQLINPNDTSYYHCISRCVRQARLCGNDPITGRNFEHRRGWIEQRLLMLEQVFAIDICAYAVMSNHLHVVLHLNQIKAQQLSEQEVLHRWHQLHHGTRFTREFEQGIEQTQSALKFVAATIATYRARLCDISWFMKELNEPIARWANREDGCTGHFWEGRFKSQALLDDAALLACMAYVDLNPVRAQLCPTPESSSFTSIRQRIYNDTKYPQSGLYPFIGHYHKDCEGLPFSLKDYLQLVDWTGRVEREDKPGKIERMAMPILERLGVSNTHWLSFAPEFENAAPYCVGDERSATQFCLRHHRQRKPHCLVTQLAA